MTAQVYKMAAAGDDTPNPDAQRVSFDDFWRAYPRRVARKDAMAAWQKISPVDHGSILAAIERARLTDDWRRDGGKYIPYPGSYLRGERWTDELEADLSMGQCCWNRNGNRGPEGQCKEKAVSEKNGSAYCGLHKDRN